MHVIMKTGYCFFIEVRLWHRFLPSKNLKSDLWLNSRSDFVLKEIKDKIK